MRVINVITAGPQGPPGPQGSQGPQGIPGSGSVDTGSFATTGSNSFIGTQRFSGSLIVTGSVIVSGSNTFTNIGPAIFSGSVVAVQGITGSIFGTATTASYISPTFISASAASSGFGSGGGTSIDTGSLVTTSSFNNFTSSYNTGSFTGSFTGNLIGTSSYATTASYISSNFQYEIHVSQVDGNDTTGNGDLLKPVATIGKALLLVSASVASTDRRTIIVHPGTYIENITINTTNTYFFSTGVLGANCLISGSVTISAATRMSGIKMTNLIVSSSNPIYINNCAVDEQMTVSGSGYLEVQNTSLQCTSGIQVVGPASSGVIFENCSLYPLTVNNASAAVYVISCNQAITPTLTAGALTITRSTISSLTSGATSTALTTAAGSVLVLESCNVYNSLLTSHAAITANGFYSIKNVIYNRSASTLASLSGTGGPLATVSQFQYINADNINSTQGLTVTGSLNITGSQTITGLLTVTQNISASSFTGSLFGTASFATTASYVSGSVFTSTNPALSASYALTASYAMNGGGGGGTPGGSPTQIQYNNAGAFGGVDKLTYDGTNLAGTGSFTGSFTGQFNGTITTALTASHAVNFTIEQKLTLNETLTDFAKVNSTIVGSNNLFQQATGSYTSAHGKYTLYKGANARAGEFVTVWNGTTTTYYDNATTDIGSTSDITFQSSIITSQLQLNAVALSSGWTVKMLVTYL
jgi:hypothetical protein